MSTPWYTGGAEYLGTVVIRHRLTPELSRRGGHVGYHVAPRRRRQGHATAMLAAAVRHCQGVLGIHRVLATCGQSSVASHRVIESNGGAPEDTEDGECRFWIGPGIQYYGSSSLCCRWREFLVAVPGRQRRSVAARRAGLSRLDGRGPSSGCR